MEGPLEAQAGPSLSALADSLGGNAHLLSVGDERIAQVALDAAKSIFDYGLSLEPISHPHLHPFIASITDVPTVTLRPSTLAKTGKGKAPPPPPPPAPEDMLPYTPLAELTVDGLDAEQVWAQLELRAQGVVKVIGEIGTGEPDDDEDVEGVQGYGYDEDSDEDDEGGSDDDEEGSDEEMTVEEWERMMADRSDSEDDLGSDEDGEEDSEEEEEDEEDEEEGDSDDSDNRVVFKNGATMSDDSEVEEDEDDEEGDSDDDDEEADSDDEEGDSEDEEDEDEDEGEEDDLDVDMSDTSDVDPDLAGLDGDDSDADDDLSSAGPSSAATKAKSNGKTTSKKGKRAHPTLDDEFFSIDEFNRLTEEAEAGHLGSGRLGGNEDEDEEELGGFGDMMLKGADEDEPLMYGDFFAPPRQTPEERAKSMRDLEKSGKGASQKDKKGKKGKEDKKGKKGKGKAKADSEEDDVDMEDDEEEDGGRDVMSRVKGDLFDSDDEQEEQALSTHEKRQLALQEQIAELEGQAIGPKDWVLMGEATSRARPENSLLEHDLDFEHAGKVVPTVTEESVASLEELIKRRILDNDFNSTVRVRAYEPTPFLPSRFFELQDTQSSKSLAQIYEDDYQNAASGSTAKDPRDEKLKKEHSEIDALWNDICYKLDALSSLNFVPKQPKAQITTIDNLPTTSMESALPTTSSTTTMLAPEEQFAPPSAASLVNRTEMTPEEKQKARQKGRKAKAVMRKGLEEMAELHGKKKRQSVKEQKEEAMKSLVKQGKGVTVIGKGSKEAEKAAGRKRASGGADGERENAKRLKL